METERAPTDTIFPSCCGEKTGSGSRPFMPAICHAMAARQIIEAGKNVVVEKPFTHSAEEAQALFDLAREKGVKIQCYQNRRFDSDFLTVQKVIESGKLGEITEVEMSFDYYRPEVPEKAAEYVRADSFVYSHACHTVDQVLSYFGIPDAHHYDVRQMLGQGRMNDYFDLDLYYEKGTDKFDVMPGGLKVSVKSSYFRAKERPSFVVYGRKGMFVKAKKDLQEADLKKFYLPECTNVPASAKWRQCPVITGFIMIISMRRS